ncbi:SUMF1/EgtB/PvdO family nonheme iron enzyme [Streptomyces sp. NPDC051636]|uniref:SUMF1/EgtB/PvdO family nonheme iron enzyme n=1 Tax=Streptomyces sp. NPDC051636 TaxID=3365663 RepID=UPI00379DCB6C
MRPVSCWDAISEGSPCCAVWTASRAGAARGGEAVGHPGGRLQQPVRLPGYRVLRGGGWFDEHWSCRASVRRRGHPAFRVDDVGFRVARSLAR